MDRRPASRLALVLAVCVAVALSGCAVRQGSPAPVSAGGSTPTMSAAASTPTRTAVPQVFIVPNLVGESLDKAEDALQSLGSYSLDAQDASGLGRARSLDASWRVCTQSPTAGSVVSVTTVVILASVTFDESCP